MRWVAKVIRDCFVSTRFAIWQENLHLPLCQSGATLKQIAISPHAFSCPSCILLFFTRSAYLLSMILSMHCLAIVHILAFHRFTTLNWLKCAQCLSTFDSRVFHIWLSANQSLTRAKKEWTWWSFCVYY